MQKRVDCTQPSPTRNLAQVLHNAFIAVFSVVLL